MSSHLVQVPTFDTLIAYVYGDMDAHRSEVIREQIQEDERLSLLVDGIESVREHHGFTDRLAHQEWLADRKSEANQLVQQHVRRRKVKKRLHLLAYASLILGMCWYIGNFPQNSAEKLYSKYQIEPIQDNLIASALPEQDFSALTDLLSLCAAHEYGPALAGFNQLLEEDPSQTGIRYLAGFCYLEIGETEAALDYFSSVYQSTASPFMQQHALWQMGLSYLKVRDFDHAIESFQAVRASLNLDQPEARKLDKKARRVVRRAKIRRFALEMYGRLSSSLINQEA